MSSGGVAEVLWVDPANIRFKIAPITDLHGRCGGDWDIERRHPLDGLLKHQAIRERFTEGRRWEDTALFRDIYRRRFAEGQSVRGTASIEELADQYYNRVDGLHASMARRGFSLKQEGGGSVPLPLLFIGRGGEVFIGNQGNHRLAIAQVLGLKEFAGKVICWHSKAQR